MIKEEEILNQAIQLHHTGKLNDAENLYRQILSGNPCNDKAIYFLGIIAYQLNQVETAIEYISKAIDINPSPEYYKDLGNIYFDLDRKQDAINCYLKVIQHNPDPDLFFNLGLLFIQTNNFNDAISCFENLIKFNPNDYEAYFNLGYAYNKINQQDKAIHNYEKSLGINPDNLSIYNELGILYAKADRITDSIQCYKKIIQLDPDNSDAYYNLGNSLRGAKIKSLMYENINIDLDGAIECYKKAVELKPDFAEALNNLGIVLNLKDNKEEAIRCFENTLKLKPDFIDAYINIGDIYRYQNDLKKAKEYYEKAVKIDPEFAETYCVLALVHYLEMDYEKGWECADYRLKVEDSMWFKPPDFPQPRWDGKESLEGKTLYVLYEQGFGDEINFVRYVNFLKDLGCKVIYKTRPALERLFRQSHLNVEIIDSSIQDESLKFDRYVLIMSLPYIFKARPDNIPFTKGYLKADPERVNYYKENYFNNNKFKIGINWQCKNVFRIDNLRSIPNLSYLYKLAELDDVKLYSLQKGEGLEQLNDLPEGIEIINLGDTFNDFADTAAAIENLDLVITVDTSVAHLSGALGKPTWILMSYAPDWRWSLEREDTIWYESVKLFRQKKPKEWYDVVDRVYNELKSHMDVWRK